MFGLNRRNPRFERFSRLVSSKSKFLDLTEQESRELSQQIAKNKYTVSMVWGKFWNGANDFSDVTGVSPDVQKKLKEQFVLKHGHIETEEISIDGTRKWLINLDSYKKESSFEGAPVLPRLKADKKVECVHIPDEEDINGRLDYSGTLCVSSQVGCSLSCSFCRTGSQRFNGNLSSGDILLQVSTALKQLRLARPEIHTPITNIVFMGQGEPFYNWRNVKEAIHKLTSPAPCGFGISPRKITVSTSGVVPLIPVLAHEFPGVRLAISLHAPNDTIRSQIMGINKQWNIHSLMTAVREYILTRALITDHPDTEKHIVKKAKPTKELRENDSDELSNGNNLDGSFPPDKSSSSSNLIRFSTPNGEEIVVNQYPLTSFRPFESHNNSQRIRVSFEYVMLDGINDSPRHARELLDLLNHYIPHAHLYTHVNLIPFNEWEGSAYRCSSKDAIHKFKKTLAAGNIVCTVRRARGADINGACGQLRSLDDLKKERVAVKKDIAPMFETEDSNAVEVVEASAYSADSSMSSDPTTLKENENKESEVCADPISKSTNSNMGTSSVPLEISPLVESASSSSVNEHEDVPSGAVQFRDLEDSTSSNITIKTDVSSVLVAEPIFGSSEGGEELLVSSSSSTPDASPAWDSEKLKELSLQLRRKQKKDSTKAIELPGGNDIYFRKPLSSEMEDEMKRRNFEDYAAVARGFEELQRKKIKVPIVDATYVPKSENLDSQTDIMSMTVEQSESASLESVIDLDESSDWTAFTELPAVVTEKYGSEISPLDPNIPPISEADLKPLKEGAPAAVRQRTGPSRSELRLRKREEQQLQEFQEWTLEQQLFDSPIVLHQVHSVGNNDGVPAEDTATTANSTTSKYIHTPRVVGKPEFDLRPVEYTMPSQRRERLKEKTLRQEKAERRQQEEQKRTIKEKSEATKRLERLMKLREKAEKEGLHDVFDPSVPQEERQRRLEQYKKQYAFVPSELDMAQVKKDDFSQKFMPSIGMSMAHHKMFKKHTSEKKRGKAYNSSYRRDSQSEVLKQNELKNREQFDGENYINFTSEDNVVSKAKRKVSYRLTKDGRLLLKKRNSKEKTFYDY